MTAEYESKYINNIIDIFYDIYREPPFSYGWLDKGKAEKYFRNLENTPEFQGYIYFHEDRVVGACMGIINDCFSNVTYGVNEFFITRSLSGQGHGTAFFTDISKMLRHRGVEVVKLSTDRCCRAFEFYKKNNFTCLTNTVCMLKVL